MPSRASPGVAAFDPRAVAGAGYRRAVCRSVGIGFGTVTTAGAMAGTAAVAAAWMVSTALSGAPHFKATPLALEMAALTQTGSERIITAFADLAAAPARSNDEVASSAPAVAPHDAAANFHPPLPRKRAEPSVEMQHSVAAPPASVDAPPSGHVAAAFDLFDPQSLAGAASVAAPTAAPGDATVPRPPEIAPAPRQAAGPPAKPAAPQLAAVAPTPSHGLDKSFGGSREGAPVAPGGRTAVYDIAAHTVYMPNGLKLEAHSGLGGDMDDPRYVGLRARGPTPPNVYGLALREGLFHGVRAIRLKPVDDGKMFGRAGILAHSYMLGPSGQSFGCVSFKNYSEFLQAFERGDVDRLLVVAHLRPGDGRQYAVNAP